MLRTAFFNGKFYAGGLNGVHRVADRLITECDRVLAAMPHASRPPAILLTPPGRYWGPTLTHISLQETPGAHSQLWEQVGLPKISRQGALVNLANLSPIAHGRKITLIHDVQFMMSDSSYPWRQRIGYRYLVPKMASTSEIVFTVSNFSRQMMDLTKVCKRDRSTTLYNSAEHILDISPDPGVIERFGLSHQEFVVIFASPKRYKNIEVVVRASAELAREGIRLVFIGPSREVLVQAGIAVPPDIIMAGKLSDEEVRGLYSHALALAFPSRTEGFGLPPLEAMSCGCPVVAAPSGAIPEVCHDAILYADTDDERSWVDGLLALRNPALRQLKIGQGIERSQRFTWADAGQKLTNAIMQLCQR